MASSASVGFRRGPFMGGIIYDSLRSVNTNGFVDAEDTKDTRTQSFRRLVSGYRLWALVRTSRLNAEVAKDAKLRQDFFAAFAAFAFHGGVSSWTRSQATTNPATPRSDRSASRAPMEFRYWNSRDLTM